MIFSSPSYILLYAYFLLGIQLPTWQTQVVVSGSPAGQLVSEQIHGHLAQLEIKERLQIHVFYVDFSRHPYLKNGYRAYTHCLDPDQGRNFRIFIHKGLKAKAQALVLAHEMVHVKQYFQKDLLIKSEKEVCWKGECFPNFMHLLYQNRPWEQEAILAAPKLLKSYRKKNIVKDLRLISQRKLNKKR